MYKAVIYQNVCTWIYVYLQTNMTNNMTNKQQQNSTSHHVHE